MAGFVDVRRWEKKRNQILLSNALVRTSSIQDSSAGHKIIDKDFI